MVLPAMSTSVQDASVPIRLNALSDFDKIDIQSRQATGLSFLFAALYKFPNFFAAAKYIFVGFWLEICGVV